MDKKIKIAICGIGNRALPKKPENSNWLGWAEIIKRSQYFQLAAANDPSEEALKRLTDRGYLKEEQTYRDIDEMLKRCDCEAVLISSPAECHASAVKKVLERDLDLLIEKPFVTDLNQGRELAGLIEKKNRTAAVIQNWRSKDVGRILRETIESKKLGRISHIFFRYVRDRENPNLPAYIFEEKYPLLYAMGIHHIDLFRYILKEEFSSVSGYSFKPEWSLYQSDTGLNLFLKTEGNTAVSYTGTFSSKNSCLPQESLLIEGENGTLYNESQWMEPPLWFLPNGKKEKIDLTQDCRQQSIAGQYNLSDQEILKNFYKAIKKEETVITSARDGLRSIAALEAIRQACETGRNVAVDKV